MKNIFTLIIIFAILPFFAQAQSPGIIPQNAEGCVPFTVQFQQENITNPADWTWYFYGGVPAQSTDAAPTVVFDEEGTHTVLLISNLGDSLVAYVNAVSAIPKITYSMLDSLAIFNTTQNYPNSTYLWEFEDGATSNSASTMRYFPDYSPHTVTLTVSNQCGTNTTSMETLAFNASVTEGCAPLTSTFTQVNPQPSDEWVWHITGTDSTTYTQANPTVVFTGSDNTPSIDLHNKYGSSIIRHNYIHVGSSNISFTSQINGPVVEFVGVATAATYLWDFGDGSTSTAQAPIHTYSALGDYTVTFTGNGLCGEITTTQTIHISSLATYIEPIDTTIDAFVKDLVTGDKQGVFNVTGQYVPASLGVFHNFATTALGLDHGVVLSTGNVLNALGPNDTDSKSTVNNLPGDNLLGSLVTYDATFLEFDFKPSTNVINFSYVFASEEYPEYVNSQFNDIFGFFVSGPGIVGQENIARIPNTDQMVSINTVNNSLNSAYYQSNVAPNPIDSVHIQFDGFTVPLVAEKMLTPFETYHIKIAIADVSDAIYDSAVFLKANSFQSKPLVFNFDFTEGSYEQTLFEDSTLLEISATLPAPAQDDITYHFSYAGDAEMGVDYIAPEIFTFQAGDTTASFKIKALADDFVEPDEKIVLVIDETLDTLTVTIKDHTALGNQHLTANSVQLTPNPTKDVFAIPNTVKATSVEIYSLAGKRVRTFQNNFDRMNIADLPKGLYSVRVLTNEEILVSKLKVE